MKRIVLIISILLTGLTGFSQNKNDTHFERFGIKVGYSIIQHLEPQIYGQNMNLSNNTVSGGTLSGVETMNGITTKAYYFFKNNLGVYFDLGFGNSSNSVNYENTGEPFIQYKTSADFNSQSIGVASRFLSEKVPVKIIIGTSIGRYGYNMSFSQTANGMGQWYSGSYDILKMGIEALVEYKLFKGLNLFSEINYSTQLAADSDNIYLEYSADDGAFYNIVYNSPSMAALSLTFGFGYNF